MTPHETKIKLSVVQNLKDVHRFLDMLEKSVKERRPGALLKAYSFLRCLVYHMNEGDLTPDSIELIQELIKSNKNI